MNKQRVIVFSSSRSLRASLLESVEFMLFCYRRKWCSISCWDALWLIVTLNWCICCCQPNPCFFKFFLNEQKSTLSLWRVVVSHVTILVLQWIAPSSSCQGAIIIPESHCDLCKVSPTLSCPRTSVVGFFVASLNSKFCFGTVTRIVHICKYLWNFQIKILVLEV